MIVNPPNGFWTEHDLEPEMMIYLWSMIDKAQTDKRDTLIGHITSSLELPDTKGKLERLLVEKSKELPFGLISKKNMNLIHFIFIVV